MEQSTRPQPAPSRSARLTTEVNNDIAIIHAKAYVMARVRARQIRAERQARVRETRAQQPARFDPKLMVTICLRHRHSTGSTYGQ